MASNLPALELWYLALREKIGIVVSTNKAVALRAKLYEERRRVKDPDLDGLMILTSPLNPTGELFITHRHIEDPDEQG